MGVANCAQNSPQSMRVCASLRSLWPWRKRSKAWTTAAFCHLTLRHLCVGAFLCKLVPVCQIADELCSAR